MLPSSWNCSPDGALAEPIWRELADEKIPSSFLISSASKGSMRFEIWSPAIASMLTVASNSLRTLQLSRGALSAHAVTTAYPDLRSNFTAHDAAYIAPLKKLPRCHRAQVILLEQ